MCWSRHRLLFTVILSFAAVAGADDAKFSVYGFADGRVLANFYGPKSFYNLIGLDTGIQASLDHVNLYTDFKPNDNTRALVEVRFLHEPDGLKGTTGTITDVRAPNGVALPGFPDTAYAVTPMSTEVSDYSTGGFLKWGGISIERAQMDLLLNQKFNFRFGKFITPAGIWNVDHGSPVITTVQQPYMFSFAALFPIAQVGLMEFGRAYFGDFDLNWSVYASSGRFGKPMLRPRDVGAGGNILLTTPEIDAKVNLGFGKVPIVGPVEVGGSVYAGTMRTSLRYMVTKFYVNEGFGAGFANPSNRSFFDSVKVDQREMVYGVNLKLPLFKYLTLQSEAICQTLYNNVKNDSLSVLWGVYGLAQYKLRINSKFTVMPYYCFEYLGSKDASANPGNRFAGDPKTGGQSIDGFSTSSFGLNLRFFGNLIVKLEYGIVDAHMVEAFESYQDTFDKSQFTTQFSIAF